MMKRASAHPRGFTLLELLVVGMLGTILIMFSANALKWYSRSVQAAEIANQLTRELKLAAEAIAQDYGDALSAQTADGITLQLDRSDVDLEYVVQANQLIRRNVDTAAELPIAAHIKELSAETVDGKLQVHLTAAIRNTEQTVTLQLEGS
jgi:prepilin-type N-terminal cleavage/methylation domain-containing protein